MRIFTHLWPGRGFSFRGFWCWWQSHGPHLDTHAQPQPSLKPLRWSHVLGGLLHLAASWSCTSHSTWWSCGGVSAVFRHLLAALLAAFLCQPLGHCVAVNAVVILHQFLAQNDRNCHNNITCYISLFVTRKESSTTTTTTKRRRTTTTTTTAAAAATATTTTTTRPIADYEPNMYQPIQTQSFSNLWIRRPDFFSGAVILTIAGQFYQYFWPHVNCHAPKLLLPSICLKL